MKFHSSVLLLLALCMGVAAIDISFMAKNPADEVNETLTPEDSEDLGIKKDVKKAIDTAESVGDVIVDVAETAMAAAAQAKKDWVENLPLCMEPKGECTRHIEPLQNDGEGLSYMGCAVIGSSPVCKIVWDTGSDQMVVVSTRTFMPLHPCVAGMSNMGMASCYAPENDVCAVPKSMFPVQIEYGSGGASLLLGDTTVALGDSECGIHQGIAELSSTEIDVVIDGNINAIGGMAPFGNDMENVRTFSICFPEEDVSAPGAWVWNDYPCGGNPLFPGNFSSGGQLTVGLLHADDPYYWAIPAETVSVGNKPVGCPYGCAVIVDTGTSFISLTHAQTKALTKNLDSALCEEESISQLPWLHFTIKGHQLAMPPWEYIRIEEDEDMFDYVPDWWQEHVDYWREYFPNATFLQKKRAGKKYQCYLALAPPMGSSKSKTKDNVILLGDSFMRKYHVSFCRDTMEVGFAKKVSYDCTLGITKGITIETPDLHAKDTRIVDNNYLQKRNELKESGMGLPQKEQYHFIEKKVKGESTSMKLRKIHPTKIMLGDAYHRLRSKEGELQKVHMALHMRRQTILNATKQQQSTHSQEI